MNKLAGLWQDLLDRLGHLGVAGVGLLLLALVLELVVVGPRLRHHDTLEAELAAAEREPRAAMPAMLTGSGPAARRQQLQAFYERFPRASEAAQVLAHIDAAAHASGVTLLSGEYRMEQRPDDRLKRYRVTLPVKAGYRQLRDFIDRVLAEVPSAALDEIDLRRENAAGGGPDTAALQARLRFTLHLQP